MNGEAQIWKPSAVGSWHIGVVAENLLSLALTDPMKRKNLLRLAEVVLVGIGMMVWWLVHHRRPAQPEGASSIAEAETTETRSNRLSQPSETSSRPSESNMAQGSASKLKGISAEQWLEERFHHPMALFGKAVDQQELPVGGAAVEFEWVNSRGEPFYVTNSSDQAGRFSISGIQGKSLNISVSKQGYYFSRKQNQTAFEYAGSFESNFYRPDPNNPVIVHVRKKGTFEQLIARSVRIRVSRDGKIAGFDPMQCKLTSAGPLLFNFLSGDRGTNLHLRIASSGGGIQTANGEFAFEAPEDGYGEAVQFNQAELQQLPEELQCYFYIGAPRLYGRIKFSKYALQGRPVDAVYFVNPSGSRNLEFDPQKVVQTVPDHYLRADTPAIDSLSK